MIFLWLLRHCSPVCSGCSIYNRTIMTTTTTTTEIPPPETTSKPSDLCCPEPDPDDDDFQLPEGCPCKSSGDCDTDSTFKDNQICDSAGFDDCDNSPFCQNRCAVACCSELDCYQNQVCKEFSYSKRLSSKLDLRKTKNFRCER